jgi:amidase
MEPNTWAQVQAGRAMRGVEILDTIETLMRLSNEALGWFANFDLLVTPTTASPPTLHGEYHRNYESGRGSAFTRPFNVTGQPAMSLPLGWPADGLPRGVQLVAAYGREDILIQVGSALEAATPWAHRHPPVFVV